MPHTFAHARAMPNADADTLAHANAMPSVVSAPAPAPVPAPITTNQAMVVSWLGRVDYRSTYAAMQAFTHARSQSPQSEVADALWLCEHDPVYTQGLAGKPEHLLGAGTIPLVATDRGGQITYHGPGQVLAYPLINLQRAGYYVKEYVYRMEEALIRTLLHFGVTGHRVAGAPGIYVRLDDPSGHSQLAQRPRQVDPAEPRRASSQPDFTGLGKIGALGIKVSRHCTYHGVALNVAMDLEPFSRINPCGYAQLQTVDLASLGIHTTWQEAAQMLSEKLQLYLAA